jgi:hypothetical protein
MAGATSVEARRANSGATAALLREPILTLNA